MLRVVASGDDDILASARDVFDVVECFYHVQLLSCCTTVPLIMQLID